jgi:hypothetical protein
MVNPMSCSSFAKIIPVLSCAVLIAACEKHPNAGAQSHSQSHAQKHGQGHGHHALAADGVQALDVYAEGNRIHLLVAVAREGTSVLLHSRSDGGAAWSEPVRVDAGLPPAHSPHRGADPQIAAIGDDIVAVWMSPGTDKWGGGPMATALSSDGGRTWRAGPNPADDGSTAGHGFVDVAAANGRFHLTWLDDREGRRGLRGATSGDAGKTWSKNTTIDPETCECCSNTLAANSAGQVALLYRDKAPRDMAVSVSIDHGAQWRTPTIAGSFGWEFDGCPHSGGGLAFGKGPSLHAAVWTGRSDRSGVYFVTSPNLGESWNPPVLLAADGVHSDLAVDAESRLAAVWDAGGAIYGKTSSDGGASWSGPVRLTAEEVIASHPRVVSAAGKFHAFWTEQKETMPVAWRTAVLPQ